MLAGQLDDAILVARRALDLSRGRKELGVEAYTLRVLGEIALRGDPASFEAAMGQYHTALALATDLGMRPLTAHCHLGLGKLYRRTGDRRRARST